MATVAGWTWKQRILHRHWRHWWYLRIDDWSLECTRCGAIKPDDTPNHFLVPSSSELDILKETRVSNPYVKFLVAVLGAVAVAVVQVFGPEGTAGQVATIVIAVLTALGVYQVPNRTA